ncbi:pyridoxine 5'-phosphate synthase [Bacteroidota bacterium]
MTRLSVNINKIATLRNARGGNIPDVRQAAIDCQRFGAEGITVHPRPDERHIRYQDVLDIKPVIETEFNIEGYPSRLFLDLVISVKPDQVTLVPDPPDAITSSEGWNTVKHKSMLREVISEMREHGIRSSIFIDTNLELIENASETGCDRVELYTEPFARDYPRDPLKAVAAFTEAGKRAGDVGLGLNAGHDLSLENLKYFNENVAGLLEVSIGHALISDALYFGLENTIQMYKRQLQ